jgi:hypothetical protein
MDSYKEFYYKKYPSEKRIDDVIFEMSARIPDIPNILDDSVTNFQLTEEVLKDGLFIENFKFKDGGTYKVYNYNIDGDSGITLWFIFGDKLIAAKINFSEYKGGVIVDTAYGKKGHWSGMAGRIYDQYLLRQYKFILSDNSHTMAGFNLYRSLLNKTFYSDIQVSVLNVDSDEETPIENVTELEKYFGDSASFLKYRFIVRRK